MGAVLLRYVALILGSRFAGQVLDPTTFLIAGVYKPLQRATMKDAVVEHPLKLLSQQVAVGRLPTTSVMSQLLIAPFISGGSGPFPKEAVPAAGKAAADWSELPYVSKKYWAPWPGSC